MKHQSLNRLISILLSALVVTALFCVKIGAATPITFQLKASKTYIKANESFDVTVTVKNVNNLKINGITLALSYDDAQIKYSKESAVTFVKGMDESTVYGNNGKIVYTWDSLSAVNILESESDIVKFSFQATNDFSSTSISLEIKDLYYLNGNSIEDITYGSVTGLNLNQVVSNAVKSVINRINAIPSPVVYTTDCGSKITAAWNEYSALSAQEKTSVSNYDVLVAAMKEYERLGNESESNNISSEVEAYKQQHAYALSRTKINVTTEKDDKGNFKDIEALKTALSEMEKLSISAQVKLITYKNTLKDVLQYLVNQVEDELKQQEEEKLIEEQKAVAKEAVEDFESQPFKWVFDLTVDTVKVTDETAISNAITALNAAEINRYAIEMLSERKKLLEALSAKIIELKVLENPEIAEEIIAAENFKTNFASVLAFTVDGITKDDELDINIANYAFEVLDDKVKALLKPEGELLAALLEQVSSLSDVDDEKETEEIVEIEEAADKEESGSAQTIIEKVVNKIIGGGDYSVTIQNRNMSRFIWFMLIAIGALTVNLCVCFGFYKYAEKKMKGAMFNEKNA